MSKHLDISSLESWLWEAACVIRGLLNGSKVLKTFSPCLRFGGDPSSHAEHLGK
jgi:hypothetical protein